MPLFGSRSSNSAVTRNIGNAINLADLNARRGAAIDLNPIYGTPIPAAPIEMTDTDRLSQLLQGNLAGQLSSADKLSALGALLKSVSRGSTTSPAQVIQNLQAQKMQEVQGRIQIAELRKQAMQEANTRVGLQAFADRLSNEDRALFERLPVEEQIKWATRSEATGFDPVTGQQVITSGPRTGQIIPRQVSGQAQQTAGGLGKPGDLVNIGGVPGRINEKGIWEALPTRANFVTETRMINGKPTLVQVDTSTGKVEELSAGTPTGEERTAGFLASRLEDSIGSLRRLYKSNPDEIVPKVTTNLVQGLFGEDVANAVKSPARQQIEAAQRDAVSAALTLSTGAAYTPLELDTITRSYFPQIGDDAATIAFKERKWNNLLDSARIKAGRAAPPKKAQEKPSGGSRTFTIGGKQITIKPRG